MTLDFGRCNDTGSNGEAGQKWTMDPERRVLNRERNDTGSGREGG